MGDRDIRTDSLEAQVARVLQARGLMLLRNSATALEIRGDTGWIAGIDPGLVAETLPEQQYLIATLAPAGRTPILLTHLPALATRSPMGRYPVVIGGDTFCGALDVPGSSRLASLAANFFPDGRVEGIDRLFRVQGGTVAISCGIGYGYVPVRFGAAPEVPVLTLRRPGGGGAAVSGAGMAADSALQLIQGLQEQAPPGRSGGASPGAP
jgi:predicted MPP superfamily phosphohydrolase